MANKAEFFRPIRATSPPKTVLKMRYAYRFAKDVHRKQRRKHAENGDSRYIAHPKGVAQIAMRFTMDVIVLLCCLLHDVLEDGGDPEDENEIELFLGEEVVTILRLVSKLPKDGYHERFVQYADWRTFFVKFCDVLHNLRTLPPDDAAFHAKQTKEVREVYLPMVPRMLSLMPPELCPGAEALIAEIHLLSAAR